MIYRFEGIEERKKTKKILADAKKANAKRPVYILNSANQKIGKINNKKYQELKPKPKQKTFENQIKGLSGHQKKYCEALRDGAELHMRGIFLKAGGFKTRMSKSIAKIIYLKMQYFLVEIEDNVFIFDEKTTK